MKHLFFITTFMLMLSMLGLSQEIAWQQTGKWKLYIVPNKKAFKVTPDTLYNFKNLELEDAIIHEYLKDAVIWPEEKYSVWMGSFVASFEGEDKKPKKIIISSYGGFIYDAEHKRYYEIPEGKREGWYKYINEKASLLNSQ